MIKLRSFTNVYNHVSKYIKNENLRKAFSIQPLLVGGNPFTTTSIYCLIHYLERKDVINFPLGGTAQIVNQLKLLLKDAEIAALSEKLEEKNHPKFDLPKLDLNEHAPEHVTTGHVNSLMNDIKMAVSNATTDINKNLTLIHISETTIPSQI